MKYLIFGINGMAGHMIAQYLIERGMEVYGFAKRKSSLSCETICGDATDQGDIKKALEAEGFDYVINGIGILNRAVDKNLAEGIFINSVLPHMLAECLQGTQAKLIHLSTDCVFEGNRGRYTETDQPDATSFYGRSKALGEVVDDKNLTIRTSIIGPELKPDGVGLFHWFMSQQEAQGYERVLWSGVTTLQLAKAIAADAEAPQTGLYHLVNNCFISKHELLLLFNQYCRQKPIPITGNSGIVNDRTLLNTYKEALCHVPDYETMVRELSEWIYSHENLYGQYIRSGGE